MQRAADSMRSVQLSARAIAGGVLSERDRLFQYTIGEVFQEMSLFITEVEQHNKAIEKAGIGKH